MTARFLPDSAEVGRLKFTLSEPGDRPPAVTTWASGGGTFDFKSLADFDDLLDDVSEGRAMFAGALARWEAATASLPRCRSCHADLPAGGDLCDGCLDASPPRDPRVPLGEGLMSRHAIKPPDENPAPMRSHPYAPAEENVPRPDTGSVATGEAAGPHAPGYLAQVGPGHAGPVRAQAAGHPGGDHDAAHGPVLSEPLEPLPARDEAADDKAQADSVSLLARWGADPSEVTAAGDDDGTTKSIAAINAAHDELDAEERQRTEALPAVADEGEQR